MASTRNKNSTCNYKQEMHQYRENQQYTLYEHSSHGIAFETRWAGMGLNPGQIPSSQLASNPVDIESFLFGVGSTNLIENCAKSGCVTASLNPELKSLYQFNLYDDKKPILPNPMIHPLHERPFPVP
jgi:hypothetical protein